MPELPEVETVVRGLATRLAGRRFVRVELHRADLRTKLPPDLAAILDGRRIAHIGRRAKYILVHLDDGGVLLLHLGMSGRLILHARDERPPRLTHDHVVFTFDDGTVLVFNDARRFGTLDYTTEADLGRHKLLQHLGPEPLGREFDG
ncbi:MAG: DNA-formamidopyrimidine glycosylase family protein, partial [Stellaceae bacterium]